MIKYLKTSLHLAKLQSIRILRDPVGTIILFGLPMILLIVSGAFTTNTDSLSLNTALVNESNHEISFAVAEALESVGMLKIIADAQAQDEAQVFDEAAVSGETPAAAIEYALDYALERALERLRNGDLDVVIHLPKDFGSVSAMNEGLPGGNIELYIDETRGQTGDIARSILNGIILELNQAIIGVQMPLNLVQRSVLGDGVMPISIVFTFFSALGLFMMGVFGAATLLPMDRKTGALRRLHAMPLSGGQLLIGTMLSFGILALFLLAVMTATAVLAFRMPLPENLVLYGFFALVSTVMLLGLGFAISGISKSPSQADVYGQIVFFASLALGGVWVPQSFFPDILKAISRFIPLTPVIDGFQNILHRGPGFTDLLPQFGVIGLWILICYTIGVKTFRWE